MPIRRAVATPTQEKTPSAAAEKEPEATSEESPSADEEQAASSAATAEGKAASETEPTENGEKADEGAAAEKGEEGTEKKDDKCKDCAAGQCATHCYVLLLRLKDGYKYEKAKVKKVKRTIPAWASVTASKKLPVTNFAGTQHRVDNILIEAVTSCNDRSGVSYQSVMKYIVKNYPGMELDKKKFLIKKSMKKHLEKGTIKQLKGKGLSGTFTIGKQSTSSKKAAQKQESLGDALPLIITRLCEPKEASYNLIKKYLEQHFPSLNIESRPDVLKTALVKAVEKGQLEQITGKGARGTFQLKRTGNQVLLKGGALEDAITAAITAMNEPKTCSTTTLRKYLVDANKDRKEYQLVANLRRTLTKCKVLGWMEQITGHGFTGTYQLSFPFYPSPTILYPDKFKEPPKTNHPPKRKQMIESSDEEESEDDEEESEDEAPSRKRKSQKRPPPKARRPPPTKKSRSVSQSKAKGKGRALAKKSPAKKAASSAKRTARRESKKESTPPPKATPVKRGAPARKPKTPAVKKLSKSGSKRPASRESSPEEPAVTRETGRSLSKRSKPEELSPEEPAVKKQATKGGSRRSEPEESSSEEPVVGKGGKRSKQSTRKSMRGKN
ncbi:heterochromatin protein 1-binding protein 3 isoform X1 [Thunnus albacares]|uniref:heterochromatin protein 1-binding protein 3 isoform X1 n=1 Tax=Thunnus maccoyii TaxID=8240 RepID=UPI001C4C37AA|nr:heterochromatin protein 1-binding protein 3 isoform X1 [Thunnus maccoyii]XP_042263416.1 heterochromatin protein 1-binding protein 3 isoform X1 [Thunnus maccoyii]XP_042263417.1 heterochromatin protein 1-binding protein 3 isoform X1 [Thunnus maccoyii]XP_044205765.1 heterochromatin protein 1-binding protein 3 isoform X1 [Thunnus albacares]XP_044205766.1 heterochromatin protein 1-binding protein 3 isoform X1 [Thunnus albacares]XP_044205767.1 heterochromatin protein 1-binding protein 3 isoform X